MLNWIVDTMTEARHFDEWSSGILGGGRDGQALQMSGLGGLGNTQHLAATRNKPAMRLDLDFL